MDQGSGETSGYGATNEKANPGLFSPRQNPSFSLEGGVFFRILPPSFLRKNWGAYTVKRHNKSGYTCGGGIDSGRRTSTIRPSSSVDLNTEGTHERNKPDREHEEYESVSNQQ